MPPKSRLPKTRRPRSLGRTDAAASIRQAQPELPAPQDIIIKHHIHETLGASDHAKEISLAVIITHHNYAHVVKRAIDSVLCQTHEAIELVIVDDASDEANFRQLRKIVEAAADPRIRLVRLAKNVGQTAAMLIGLDKTSSDFVAYLDPDDFYEPTFAELMLRAHLNPRMAAPLVACEMGLYKVGGGKVASSQTGFVDRMVTEGRLDDVKWSYANFGFSHYFPAVSTGWFWAATSSLVFRRDALEFLRVKGPMEPGLRKICGDGFLVYGAHMLGGTLFVHETLSWRGIHSANAVLPSRFLGGTQTMTKPAWSDTAAKDFFLTNHEKARAFVIRTLLRNGAAEYFQPSQLGEVVSTHLNSKELSQLCQDDEHVRKLMWRYGSNAPA